MKDINHQIDKENGDIFTIKFEADDFFTYEKAMETLGKLDALEDSYIYFTSRYGYFEIPCRFYNDFNHLMKNEE